jgi:hypothetical protein
VGSITFVGSGSATSGTGAGVVAAAPVSPNLGVAGDLQIIAVQVRPGGAGASISGWTGDIIEGVSGGSGSEGAGTGTTKTMFFIRELTAAAGSVTVAPVGHSVCQVQQHILRKAAGDTWDVLNLGGGADNSVADLTFQALAPAIPVAGRVTVDDWILALAGSIDDTGVFSSESIGCVPCSITTTARGTAGGSGTTGGNDARFKMTTGVVTSGSNTTSSQPSFTAINSVAGDAAGSVVFARVRAVTPASGLTVKVWNGSAEVAATIEGVWNGSTVVPMASLEIST